MATPPLHVWLCPSCGRRVPLRADACHCGMTRARAAEVPIEAAAAEPPRRGPRGRGDRQAALAAMTGDVKALVAVALLLLVAGLGWAAFGPEPERPVPVLGFVDAGAPKAPAAKKLDAPPFKLPWWK